MSVGLARIEIGILSLRVTERYLWAHSVMHHHNELNVTKELATGSCVTERVKRLAGNEIERGMGRSNLGQVTYR